MSVTENTDINSTFFTLVDTHKVYTNVYMIHDSTFLRPHAAKRPVGLKPEKPGLVRPVTTRTTEEKQGLNLYGHFIQMPVI